MVVDTTLYDLLDVKPDASQTEIKQAYQRMARKLHPDKNRDDPDATSKFQALNEAYDILKDEEKREVYDRYGPDGLKEMSSADVFSHLFNTQGRRRTRDIVEELSVTLEEFYNGAVKNISVERRQACRTCNGTGARPGAVGKICPQCDGQGRVIIQMGFVQGISECPACNGAKTIFDKADACETCHGEMLCVDRREFEVHVERGSENGDKVVFQGASNEVPGADPGDVVVVLKQEPHSVFERRHNDLLFNQKITLYEALYGTKFVIHHLDGRKLIVSTSKGEVVNPDSVKIIQHEGMPQRGNPFERGTLYVRFAVEFPEFAKLTPALGKALKEVMPPVDRVAGISMGDENVFSLGMEGGNIEDYNNARKTRKDRRGEAYNSDDDDDDDEEDGEEGTACQPM
jgi:DnaJ-class molecular chaperone